jgi:hypothetical protein
MKKDIEILEGTGSFIYRSLPLFGFIFGLQILSVFISWPLAIGLSAFIFWMLHYWIPERLSVSFLRWVIFSVVISSALLVAAYIVVKLGWVNFAG